jgi:hypothetical protein
MRSYIARMTSTRGLPPGFGNPNEIINEAVARVLSQSRTWDTAKHSIITVIYGTVRSLLSKEKGLYAREGRKPLGQVAGDVEPVPRQEVDTSLSAEEANLRWSAVKDVIKKQDDRELLDYVEAIHLGIEKPAEIAEATGIPIERIYECPRRLQRLARSIRNRLNELEQK